MIDIIRFTHKDKNFIRETHRIRTQVFVSEQKVPKNIEYENEESAAHYLAFYNGVPAATARWRLTENGVKLERFATVRAFRNKGLAAGLLKRVLNDTSILNNKIYLHAQAQVVGFYEKYGFAISGEQFMEAGIKHFPMEYKTKS